eukprot:Tamp_04368.p1 GENE.Tamp_04368~~Tamp_04368.p1  ORF type:complete len:577 (+),score=96.08 Tamp_04368:56-1732(+)
MDQAIAHVGGWGEHQKWTCLYCGVPWLIAGMFAFGPVLYSKEMMQENEWGGCREEQMANSIYFAANFVGNAVFGPIADAVGRRRGVIASLATTALGGMLSITAQSWPHYLAARALVGLGNSGVCLVSSVLISEVVSADVRSLVVCFYLQVFFAVGIMLGIPTDHVTSTYRTAIAVPTCLSILWFNVLVLDLPESPRYLLAKGHARQALTAISGIGTRNKRQLPAAVTLYEKTTPKNESARVYSMMDLWNCPTLRALTGNLCTQWFIIGLTYYGLTLATSRFPGSVYFNLFASALVEIPAYYIAMRVMDVHGRRKVLIASHVTVSVACSLYLLFSGPSTAAGVARSVLAMVGKLGVSGAFGVAYIYGMEAFPTCVRNMGTGVTTQFGNMGGLLAPHLLAFSFSPPIHIFASPPGGMPGGGQPRGMGLPISLEAAAAAVGGGCEEGEPGSAIFLFVVLSLGGAFLSRLLPETLGVPLPETIADLQTLQTLQTRGSPRGAVPGGHHMHADERYDTDSASCVGKELTEVLLKDGTAPNKGVPVNRLAVGQGGGGGGGGVRAR